MQQFSKKKVLLIGPPNVGKSVIFNKLTGLNVAMANYSGTTVDYKKGQVKYNKLNYDLIDVPGTYTLDATNEAEQVAIDMLSEGADLVITVLDANNLESSLYLLLQVLEKNLPTIAVLNRVDLLKEKGYEIAHEKLSNEIGIDIIKTIAVSGEGIDSLEKKIEENISDYQTGEDIDRNIKADWFEAERLDLEYLNKKNSTYDLNKDTLGDKLSRPWPGIPLAIVILGLIFGIVVGIGMGMRQYLLLPFFRGIIFPFIYSGVEAIVPPGIIRNILIGEYGFFIKGLEWPFALVFPYVVSFYTALSILEDSGYLPRLGVLLDGLFKKVGLTGGNIIPLLLGYGCAIPGIAATRALPTKKERVTVSSLICLAVPCISQTGALISLLAEQSIIVMILVFTVSFLALIIAAIILDKTIEGKNELTIVEIPPLLWPGPGVIAKKIWLRVKMYINNGALVMIYAIAGASLLFELGILEYLGQIFQPIVQNWLQLPAEASAPLLLGIVRRELAVLPLLEMGLNSVQLFVGAVVALFYVPCIAVLAMLAREFDLKLATKILVLTIGVSFLLGGIFARIGNLIMMI